MSVRSSTGHYFATGAAPSSVTSWAKWGVAKVNSDLGASVQLLAACTFDGGGGDGTALYWDATADDMLLLSLESGVPISGGAGTFGSRPAVGEWFAWYLQTNGTTTSAGWRYILIPGNWVNSSCTALSAQISSFNAIEITSNSNPCNSDHRVWRCKNGTATEAEFWHDLGGSKSSGLAGIFDFHLISTSNIVEQTGSGATCTSQGGTLSNGDTFVWPRKSRLIASRQAVHRAAFH